MWAVCRGLPDAGDHEGAVDRAYRTRSPVFHWWYAMPRGGSAQGRSARPGHAADRGMLRTLSPSAWRAARGHGDQLDGHDHRTAPSWRSGEIAQLRPTERRAIRAGL